MRYRTWIALAFTAALALSGCAGSGAAEPSKEPETAAAETSPEPETASQEASAASLSLIDPSKWNYNEEDGVYWQIEIPYCASPAAPAYETLGIFVPEAYMEAQDNNDGTYTCRIKEEGAIGSYTAMTAPIVIPVNTPGYSAMAAPADYVSAAADYTQAGFIYVNAGCRGREEGAPAGVTDLKAAVRYIRYNEGSIPGSMERIFTFGMSGGGAQSALMGATGDSELYLPYLEAIGAVMDISDAVAGSMCWCPVTNLDYANEAYEWNMGVSRTGLDEEMQTLSNGMAQAFALYINSLGLKDEEGALLTLDASETGIYQAGSYYDYMKTVIETSLNHFLEDTSFPYTPSSGKGMGGGLPGGGFPGRDGAPGMGGAPDGDGLPGGNDITGGFVDEYGRLQNDGINRGLAEQEAAEPQTYETVQDYIDSLNQDTRWVSYDSASHTASITSVEDFVKACKKASKNIGAFDDLEGTQGENVLFGYGDGAGTHFDPIMAELLKDNEAYGPAYAADLSKQDILGNTVDVRMNMYNPMYYLCSYYEGYQTSNVAGYWRIRTGITQGDTALSTEMNLALALENYGCQVDFETIWAQGHTMAERTGSPTENFIQWVNGCLAQ
ncbi:subtype A tannase [Lacrimispora sp. 210928-DFI.3.58]|uniref:subtype A tannase n=1 Tax=Lacrimispora sp. 210928-DFI.3.58 TaxID=2883214 RepID=UPI001D071767|nr:subtype A tannase [Lacrimispora sp. 210928-DFI.3.58]MCB7317334.1 tannase [Lacrimispora sp. 210928-DFI.3.58]